MFDHASKFVSYGDTMNNNKKKFKGMPKYLKFSILKNHLPKRISDKNVRALYNVAMLEFRVTWL